MKGLPLPKGQTDFGLPNFRVYFPQPSGKRLRRALPLFLTPVRCGFPSPAEDFVDLQLDLNEHLIRHPAATFFVQASGNSMEGAGIHSGDLLIIDRAPTPTNNSIVLAVLNGEFMVKRLRRTNNGKIYLLADNPAFAPLEITPQMEFEIWGVVTAVIHQFNRIS